MNDLTKRPDYLSDDDNEGFADQLGFARPPRISMLDDKFRVLDENGDVVKAQSLDLKVIMLWENATRIYYEGGSYDPDNPAPPMCFSDDRVRPSENAQVQQAEFCQQCPRAERNLPSFKGTTMVSACKQRYKVAVLVAGDKAFASAYGRKPFLLDIGPASLGAYERYRAQLRTHHASARQVITGIGYSSKQFSFDFRGWVDKSVDAMVRELCMTDEPRMIVSDMRPRAKALPPPERGAPPPRLVASRAPGTYGPPEPAGEPEAFGGAPTPPVQTPGPSEPPKRPRGRPPKEAPASPPPPAASAAPSTPRPSPPAPKGNGDGFGVGEPQAAPIDMQAALDEAFGR